MNMKKLLSLVLALILCCGAMALAEEGDLQAKLDEANAQIEALQAEVELYKPYYEQQIVAEYGDGKIIWREDAMAEYDTAASYYSQYGLNIETYADQIKVDILENMVKDAVLKDKAAELGLDQLSDEEVANLQAETAQNYETYIENYKTYFAEEGATDEEAREQTIAAMEGYGMTQDSLYQQMLESYVNEQLHANVIDGIDATDEDVQAKYEEMLADAQAQYADDAAYNNARNSGETIAWNPEGYRAVKQVLIQFDDEQSARYSELQDTLDSLTAELKALDAPAEAETEPAEDAEAEPAEDAEAEPAEDAEAEPAEAPRSREEIQADIGRIGAEIEALYSELLPEAQQVIVEFNQGADFDSLIEKYNDDPGMKDGIAATEGYAVSANSTVWDPTFTEGAMGIEAVGQISAPLYGSYGIYIIYYMSDITPGAVPLEEIRDAVYEEAFNTKINDTYNAQVDAWVQEANPVYHVDRF